LLSARILGSGTSGLIKPEVLHHLDQLGPARFYVEFHRAP